MWAGVASYTPRIIDPVRVLVVCTANQCRSPMAAALLAARLSARGIAAQVDSAGTYADAGHPATELAITVMAERGIDLSGHRSRPLHPALVASANLVIGMTRGHVREAIVMSPTVRDRAFTLRAIVRDGEREPRRALALPAWLAGLSSGRTATDLLGDDPLDDVDDPIGRPPAAYRATAAVLDDLATRLVRVAWPDRV